MHEIFEISDRYIEAADANDLLYEPLSAPFSYRRTRRYRFDFSGEILALGRFVKSTLYNEVSQEIFRGEDPVMEGTALGLEYGMKPSALDLEKEAILQYYQGISEPGFSLEKLEIRQRIYVFGEYQDGLEDRFVKDICNPAIHVWKTF